MTDERHSDAAFTLEMHNLTGIDDKEFVNVRVEWCLMDKDIYAAVFNIDARKIDSAPDIEWEAAFDLLLPDVRSLHAYLGFIIQLVEHGVVPGK